MFTPVEVVLVCSFFWIMSFIGWSMQLFAYGSTVLYGAAIGFIMGDVQTGLLVGGTLGLMGLGVGGYGGSSVPDYALGTVAGTVFAIGSGQGLEVGLAIGIPVATLGTQFDVFAKMSGSFFIHKQMECAERQEFNKMGIWVLGWQAFRASLFSLPILLAMTVGSDLITNILNAIPAWLMSGFSVAAGALPAVGFCILLKYMPVKKYGVFLILGFVLTAYLSLPMVAIALLAFIAAYLIFQGLEKDSKIMSAAGGNEDE